MTKNLIKSIFLSNVPLAICATLCLVISNFVMLYELSFAYKVTEQNVDATYYVAAEGMTYHDAADKISALTQSRYNGIYCYLDNGIAIGKPQSHFISKGRSAQVAGEVIANGAIVSAPNAQVHYGGKVFTVVGIFEGLEAEIFIDPMLNNCAEYKVDVIALNGAATASRTAIKAELSDAFKGCEITPPPNANIAAVIKTTPIFVLVILLMLLAAFTYGVCMRYLFSRARKPFTVYLFLGFSADYILIRLLSFVFISATLLFAICGGIFAVAEAVVSTVGVGFVPYVTLGFTDYLLVFALFILISIPMFIPVVKDLLKKSLGYKYV